MFFNLLAAIAACCACDNHFDYCDAPMEDPGYISHELYESVVENFPIACVDIFVYNPAKQSYLLVLRGSEPAKGGWWLPGGRIKKGESFFDAARRKCQMEVGLSEVDLQTQLGGAHNTMFPTSAWGHPTQTVNIAIFGTVGDDNVQIDEDHERFKWVPIHEEPDDPYVRKVYRDAVKIMSKASMI